MTGNDVDRLDLAVNHFRISPEDALRQIVSLLHSTSDPDFALIASVGAGPLESLFHQGEEETLWPQLEELARNDARFRRALAAVWAFDSPRYRDREALLEELGEYQKVMLRIVVEPRTFDAADGFEWRSFNVDGLREQPHLAGLLRGIADQLDATASELDDA